MPRDWLYGFLRDPPVARDTRALAEAEGRRSGLPGYAEGPQDALRHIIGAAELRRRHGLRYAAAVVNINELLGDALYAQDAATVRMDNANNAIGLHIGGTARTYAEVVDRARDMVAASLRHGGSGAEGTPIWLPPERWLNQRRNDPDVDRNIPTEVRDWEMDPSYRHGGAEHAFLRGATPREREARLLADLEGVPPEAWSPEDVRAVIRSRPYADPNDRARATWHERVRRFYEAQAAREAERDAAEDGAAFGGASGSGTGDDDGACGGTAQVRAYTRRGPSGPVAVAAHERGVTCR